jgi:DNA-binding response OmpR family regulator
MANAVEQIDIESELHDAPQLMAALRKELDETSGVSFETRQAPSSFRMDPVIVSALITGGAAILAPLVVELAKLLGRKPGRVVRIEDVSGAIVDVPADADVTIIDTEVTRIRRRVVRITLREA